ncbi:MAG TPA: hypothetical protein VE987_18115 [Polyangiaceae bacterium]|nr:hypothetical protein [Polyangiaceae bacterium]
MSRGKHTPVPGLKSGAPAWSGPAAGARDDEPPSGVMLRSELLARVPRLVVSTIELQSLPLDHRAGFIMSFVDGTYTVEMILDACAMRRDDALAILRELAARGVIALD